MIDCVYYNDCIRCYRDGRVERKLKGTFIKGRKIGEWYPVEINKNQNYTLINIDGKNIRFHRLIGFCFKGLNNLIGNQLDDVIDHINHNTHDNRVENLRVCSKQQNAFNREVKGCYYIKTIDKWLSKITINDDVITIGYFSNEEDAHKAYLEAKQKYHLYD